MSKRLLILVDDEPVISRTLALDLTDAGYEVQTAADGREALRRMRSEVFDLVIAPDGHSEEDGTPTLEEVRKVQPAAKIVLMTTDPDANGPDRKDLEQNGDPRRRGAIIRVRKPFDLEEFRSVVGRLLGEEVEASGSAP